MSFLDEMGLTIEDVREAVEESLPARARRRPSRRPIGPELLPLGTVISGEEILREGLMVDERERPASKAASRAPVLPPLPPVNCTVQEAAEYDRAIVRFLESDTSGRIVDRYGDRLLDQSASILARARRRAANPAPRSRRLSEAQALLRDCFGDVLQDDVA